MSGKRNPDGGSDGDNTNPHGLPCAHVDRVCHEAYMAFMYFLRVERVSYSTEQGRIAWLRRFTQIEWRITKALSANKPFDEDTRHALVCLMALCLEAADTIDHREHGGCLPVTTHVDVN